MTRKHATRMALALAAWLLGAACRYDVVLDEPPLSDAGQQEDAQPVDASRGPDAAADAGPLTRACIDGHEVAPSPATEATSAPTLAHVGAGPLRRYALLLPPPARVGSSRTALYLLDAEGNIASLEELELLEGGGGPAQTPTVHARRDAAGLIVLSPTEARVRDELGGWSTIALPRAPVLARQREAGWIDEARFVYVGQGAGEPLVIVEPALGTASVSSLQTEGSARVLIGVGSVVVSATPPLRTIREFDGAFAETLRVEWPMEPPLGPRLVGAMRGAQRRWLVHDDGEFRTQVELYRVDAMGPEFLLREQHLGPLSTRFEDELVAISTSDGGLSAFDFLSEGFTRLVPGGVSTLALVTRGEPGFAVVTRELRGGVESLFFRCVAE